MSREGSNPSPSANELYAVIEEALDVYGAACANHIKREYFDYKNWRIGLDKLDALKDELVRKVARSGVQLVLKTRPALEAEGSTPLPSAKPLWYNAEERGNQYVEEKLKTLKSVLDKKLR